MTRKWIICIWMQVQEEAMQQSSHLVAMGITHVGACLAWHNKALERRAAQHLHEAIESYPFD